MERLQGGFTSQVRLRYFGHASGVKKSYGLTLT